MHQDKAIDNNSFNALSDVFKKMIGNRNMASANELFNSQADAIKAQASSRAITDRAGPLALKDQPPKVVHVTDEQWGKVKEVINICASLNKQATGFYRQLVPLKNELSFSGTRTFTDLEDACAKQP